LVYRDDVSFRKSKFGWVHLLGAKSEFCDKGWESQCCSDEGAVIAWPVSTYIG
jgi:hypothetical protein